MLCKSGMRHHSLQQCGLAIQSTGRMKEREIRRVGSRPGSRLPEHQSERIPRESVERFRNRSVIVVGSSPDLLAARARSAAMLAGRGATELPLASGAVIDAFDEVVRFNKAPGYTGGSNTSGANLKAYGEQMGMRTTVHVLNGWVFNTFRRLGSYKPPPGCRHVALCEPKRGEYFQNLSKLPTATLAQVIGEEATGALLPQPTELENAVPTCGFMVVSFLVRHGVKPCLIGFSFNSSHFDNPNAPPSRAHNWHNYQLERRRVEPWAREGRVCLL